MQMQFLFCLRNLSHLQDTLFHTFFLFLTPTQVIMISNNDKKSINDSTELDGEQNTHTVSGTIKEIVIE